MTRKRYGSELELAEIVRKFENATIGRDKWKHAEHMVVALFYLRVHDLDTGSAMIR